jgi:hypothetical protein
MTQADRSPGLARPVSPGYLLGPFGWAAQPLLGLLEADPSLCRALFTLSRQRMHLIALALLIGRATLVHVRVFAPFHCFRRS